MPRQVHQRRIATNGNRLPTKLPENIVVTDVRSQKWKFGKPIGLGGFGEIYLASDNIGSRVAQDSPYVAKVEFHSSGPLFVEMNFYLRAARRDMIENWAQKQSLSYHGMPHYLGSGSFWYKEEHFRFLIIPRYGQDLEKMFLEQGRRFHLKTVLSVGLQVMNTLEYVHDKGYVHVDIKGANLLVGAANDEQDRVFLVDFGLALKYQIAGVHKPYQPDQRRAHDGTLEYTSRDAHQGAHSRRGDLEVLAYNLVQWLCSYLPWEADKMDYEDIQKKKETFMQNPAVHLRTLFPNSEAPLFLEKYLEYVATLGFETKPDYDFCREMFRQGLRDAGYKDDGRLNLNSEPIATPPKFRKVNTKKSSDKAENIAEVQPKNVFLDTASAAQHQSLTNRNKNRLPDQRGLDNPTPAMVKIIEARINLFNKSGPKTGKKNTMKRVRSESNSLPAEDILTEAMIEVMQQRTSTSSSVQKESKRGRRHTAER